MEGVSAHSSGTKGATLRLAGTGFSSDLTAYEREVAGETCEITQANENEVIVSVPPQATSNTNMGALPQVAGDSTAQ